MTRPDSIDSQSRPGVHYSVDSAEKAGVTKIQRNEDTTSAHEISNMELGALALPGGILDGSTSTGSADAEDSKVVGDYHTDPKFGAANLPLDDDMIEKQIETIVHDASDFPDGGWRAWS